MNVLFTVDNYFYKHSNGKVYSKGLYPYSIWERYLSVFDKIIVAARITEVEENQDLEKMNVSSGPNVVFINVLPLNSPLNKIKNYSKAKDKLRELMLNVDCLIARIPSEISSLAIKVANNLDKPWSVEVVSCTWDAYWNHGSLKGKVYAPLATLKTKNETKKSKFTLYVTKYFLQQRYPSNGNTVNCSNAEIINVDDNVLEKRLITIKNNEKIIKIGFIGYLGTNIKGLDTALKALSKVKHSFENFEFHILGDGNNTKWKQMARDLNIEKQTVFHGFIPTGNSVFSWIDDIDMYIHPSRQEGLPRAVIEVMSRGCPVIASNVGGIPELLPRECLHDPNDYKKLAVLIIHMITDKDYRMKVAMNNFSVAKQYTKPVLDQRRTDFWNSYKEYCKSK